MLKLLGLFLLTISLVGCTAPGGALRLVGPLENDGVLEQVPAQEDSGREAPRSTGSPDGPVGGWDFTASTYVWLARKSGVIESAENLVLDDPDESVGAFLYLEGEYRQRWGFIADFDLLSTEDRTPGVGGDIVINEDTVIAELDGTWRPDPDSNLQFLAGVRVLDSSQDIDFPVIADATVDTTQVDPVIGAQGTWQLDDAWRFRLRTDIGGFGLDSDFTYQSLAVFAWEPTPGWNATAGYRVLGYEYEANGARVDLRLDGLLLGLAFAF